jgi:hypothetical protein
MLITCPVRVQVRIPVPPAASPMRTSLTPDATATDRPAGWPLWIGRCAICRAALTGAVRPAQACKRAYRHDQGLSAWSKRLQVRVAAFASINVSGHGAPRVTRRPQHAASTLPAA